MNTATVLLENQSGTQYILSAEVCALNTDALSRV